MPSRIASIPPDPMDTEEQNTPKGADMDASGTAEVNAAENNKNAQNGAAADNRRRSTRVIKKPNLPYSQPSPPKPTRAKRKRLVQDEAEEEEEEEEEEGEEGEEEEGQAGGEQAEDGTAKPDGSQQGENESNDDTDDEESSEESLTEDEDEGEPDEEEKKDQRRRSAASRGRRGKGRAASTSVKRPPVKKTRTASGATPAGRAANGPKRGNAKGKGKAKAKQANGGDREGGDSEPSANRLYDSVFEDGDEGAAEAWTALYEEDTPEAMKELINFILKCCGCDKYVTNYDIEDQDTANTTLSQIQEAFQRQKNAEYPLTSKKPEFKRFRQTLASFLRSLITTFNARELLYTDPQLMEGIEVWITAMSSSTLRQFRHTATIVALEFVGCLAQIAAEARKANSVRNRQVEAEEKKVRRNEGRIGFLMEKTKEGEEKREMVENVIKDIFNIVFVHRYRDIDAKIRADCIRELGQWILILPDLFFEGSYLRYLGWVLSDTTPQTRLEVVKALTKLFRKKDSIANLRHFTERFRPRMVEMAARDADSNVRASAVDLLDAVREVGYLEPEDIDTVSRLLFDSEPRVRRAVVPFFVENIKDVFEEKVEELGGADAVEEVLGDDGSHELHEGPTPGWLRLKCLVQALASYDLVDANEDTGESSGAISGDRLETRFSLAGDALWEEVDEVRDWEVMAKYLLYDHSRNRIEEGAEEEDPEKRIKSALALDPNEESILLQLLNASVATSIDEGGELGHRKKGTTKRTGREIDKHYEAVSRTLTAYIPPLLKKFGPVPDTASSVLRLEQLMKLDVFQELRQSKMYAALLGEINRQFLTHADESVLKEASAAILHAKTFDGLDEVTDKMVRELKDTTVTMLANAIRGKNLGKGKFSDATLTELINTVRRLEYLASITDFVEIMEAPPLLPTDKTRPIDALMDLLKRGGRGDDLEDELTTRTMKTLEYYFMWKSSNITDRAIKVIDELVTRGEAVMERISATTKAKGPIDLVKTTAGTTLLGLATLFIGAAARVAVREDRAELVLRISALGKKIDKPLEAELLKMFEILEKTFAKSSGKTLEPGEDDAPQDEEEDVENGSESAALLHEQRLCEFTGKVVLAVLAGAVNEKTFRKRLTRNRSRLGPNFREIVAHLDVEDKAKAAPPAKKLRARKGRSEEVVVDEGEEEHVTPKPTLPKPKLRTNPRRSAKRVSYGQEEEESEREEVEEVEEAEVEEVEEPEATEAAEAAEQEEGHNGESDKESEPDPEVEVPPDGDGDEEMPDAGA